MNAATAATAIGSSHNTSTNNNSGSSMSAGDVEELRSRVRTLEMQVRDKEDKVTALSSDLEFERLTKKSVEELRRKLDERVSELTGQLSSKDADLTRAKSEVSRQGSDQQKESIKMEKALKKANMDMDTIKSRAKTDVNVLEQRLANMEAASRQLIALVSSMNDEVAGVRKQLSALKTNLA